jgi:hypothetical protein
MQIFQTMRRYSLGSEHAVKAMTVSDALARAVAESGGNVSVLQAVTDLTLKLSKAKFGQQQLQEQQDETVDGSVSSDVAASATSSSDLDLVVVVPATPIVSTRKQAPDLRIKPVAHAHARSSSFSSTKAVVGGGPSATSKKAKSTNKNGKSVKSKDVSKDTQQETNSRARSDSVSDIVTAKLGAEKTAKTDADKTVKNAPTTTPASVRAKRGRGEDNEVTASTHKRSRQSHKDAA